MSQKHNNLLILYREGTVMYRITKIRNTNVLELDEIFDDPNLAKMFFDDLVSNIEYSEGISATVSSPKNKHIQGGRAIYVAKFGNLGIEVGLSIRPIVAKYRNLRELASGWEGDNTELILPTEERKSSFIEKLKSFIR